MEIEKTVISTNYFLCRYCEFNSENKTNVLLKHYKEEHPVTTEDCENPKVRNYYQAGELIAVVGIKHPLCCKYNCINNSAKNQKLEKLCIRLKWGGDYTSIEHYFMNDRKYFDAEKGVFMCFANFEESASQTEEGMINWISIYGCAITFKLKFFEEIKNHNLIVLKKTSLPKHINVKKELKVTTKCEVTPTQEILLQENQRLVQANCELTTLLQEAREENKRLRKLRRKENGGLIQEKRKREEEEEEKPIDLSVQCSPKRYKTKSV